MRAVLHDNRLPLVSELRTSLLDPILARIGQDDGEAVQSATAQRVVHAKTLDEIAAPAKITRERIRQYLQTASRIMDIRWPEGEFLIGALLDRLWVARPHAQETALARNALRVLYPNRQAGAGRLASTDATGESALSPNIEPTRQ